MMLDHLQRFSPEQYHTDAVCDVPTLSRSVAHTLLERSPLHAYTEHPRLGNAPRKYTSDAMDLGTVVHRLALGVGNEYEVGDFPNWMTKAAKEWREEVRAEGRVPILRHDFDRAEAVYFALRDELDARGMNDVFTETLNEVGIVWTEGDVTCRAMLDAVKRVGPNFSIYDLKTTSFGHPRALPGSFAKYGYDLQSEMYTRGMEVLFPESAGCIEFTFIFVETSPPYPVTICTLGGMFRAIGRAKYDRAVRIWGECMKSGVWPAYTDAYDLEPPAWMLNSQLGAEAMEGVEW